MSGPNSIHGSIDFLDYEFQAECNVPCRIRFANGQIRVTWEEGGRGTRRETVEYIGTVTNSEHYELECPGHRGKATLHRFPGAQVLVGDLFHEGQRGMWRICLLPAQVGGDE